MALDQSALGSALADVFSSMPATKEAAAAAIAEAYYEYAQAATFGASLPVILDAMRDAMADTLATGLTVPGLPATVAAAWAGAVGVFWAAVPVAGGSGVGATTGCPGAGSLIALQGVFANVANTAESCGNGCAAALHAATMTVLATLTLPPNPPAPVPIA